MCAQLQKALGSERGRDTEMKELSGSGGKFDGIVETTGNETKEGEIKGNARTRKGQEMETTGNQ